MYWIPLIKARHSSDLKTLSIGKYFLNEYFLTATNRNLALQRHRQHMGNRYIEVFKAPSIDFIQMNAGTLPQVERFLGQA